MIEAEKAYVVETLQVLLDRMEVCNSKDCFVCKGVKRKVETLASVLGIDATAIMPHRLRGAHN